MKTRTQLDMEQLVADLAWDFCEKTRRGEVVPMKKYLNQCPSIESRSHFKELVNTDLFLRVVVGAERQRRGVDKAKKACALQ